VCRSNSTRNSLTYKVTENVSEPDGAGWSQSQIGLEVLEDVVGGEFDDVILC
jgi:hypothetical protein